MAQVASPPAKPVMIFDGDCSFCTRWVSRLRHATGDRVDFLAFHDASVAAQFREVPRQQFETAVQLVETDGTVYGGAEAVFRALAHNPRARWLLNWYYRCPALASASEWVYRRVARHRKLISFDKRARPGDF